MRSFFLLLVFTCTLVLHAQQTDFKHIDFAKADNIAARYAGEDLKNLPILALRLTAQLHTDVERFRAIYYWVTHNVKGDYYMTHKNEQQRIKLQHKPSELGQWNQQFKKEVFTRLREDKVTLCSGYAYLVKELANLAGLECEMVFGYGSMNLLKSDKPKIPNHSWNAVKLDGNWYLCDPTWSSGVIAMKDYRFQFKFDDTFFLMDPIEFAKTHQPLTVTWMLLESDISLKQGKRVSQ